MKIKILLLLLLVFFYVSLSAQLCTGSSFQKVFEAPNDERAHSICATADGGYIIVGETNSAGAGGKDVFAMKLDVNGNQIWSKTYGTTKTEYGSSLSIIETQDGGYLFAGHTDGVNGYVVKLDASGNVQWEKKEPDTLYRGLKELANGDIALVGNAYSFGSGTGTGAALLVRVSSSGTMLWSKGFGGSDQEQMYNVLELVNGDLLIVGGTSSYGLGVGDAFIVKTTNSGNLIWSKNYGGPGNESYYSAKLLNDGNIVVVGMTTSYGAGNDDILLSKIDTSGVVLWTKIYGGTNIDRGEQVEENEDGELILVGYSNSVGSGDYDKVLLNIDNTGVVNWIKAYGYLVEDEVDRWGNPMVLSQDSGVVMVGGTKSFGFGDENIYVVKTNSCGETFCYENDVIFSVSTPSINSGSPNASTSNSGSFSSVVSSVAAISFTTTVLCDSNLVGINNTLNQLINILVAPNPNNGQFNVVINNNEVALIEVYDVMGKQVFVQNNVNANKTTIDLTDQSKGVYFVRVSIGEQVLNEKVVYQ